MTHCQPSRSIIAQYYIYWEKFLDFIISRIHHGLVGKKIGSKELSLKIKMFCFCFYFRYLLPPCRHKSTPSSFQSRRRRNPSSAIRKSSEEKKRNEALCGREDTKGDLKQNGFEAVELAKLNYYK